MTPEEAAFLDAILEAPEDDTPRLVFADWLEDHGRPERAELFRLQVELARWVPDLGRRTELRRRERDILQRREADWLGGLAPFCVRWHWRRGLPHVTMRAGRLLGKAFRDAPDGLLRSAWVESLRVTDLQRRHLRELTRSPALHEVGALDLGGNGLDDALSAVPLCADQPARLSGLCLAGNALTNITAAALVGSRLWARLRRLDLRNNRIAQSGADRLLAAWPEGACLDLHGNADVPVETLLECFRRRGPQPDRRMNSLGMEFVRVPAGSFLMGSPADEAKREPDEGPRHPVTLTRPFWLAIYQVTQRAFAQVMDMTPSQFGPSAGGGPHHPVEHVSWDDAVEFCRRLGDRPEEKAAGRTYRLPTEAEWEHACRAGTETAFWWGDSADATQANFDGGVPYGRGRRGPYLQRTQPVGSYQANPFGLYDTHGNLWDWVADWYSATYYQEGVAVDPAGPAEGTQRVLRGGSWHSDGPWCRSAERRVHQPGNRSPYDGFRVVLVE
jgi:uncharacterized protein (TIGR02996 family)